MVDPHPTNVKLTQGQKLVSWPWGRQPRSVGGLVRVVDIQTRSKKVACVPCQTHLGFTYVLSHPVCCCLLTHDVHPWCIRVSDSDPAQAARFASSVGTAECWAQQPTVTCASVLGTSYCLSCTPASVSPPAVQLCLSLLLTLLHQEEDIEGAASFPNQD